MTKAKTQSIPETRLSVRLKGPLATHADRKVASALYESHSEYIRDLIRRDMAGEEAYDLRAGIIEGYADIAAGRVSEALDHDTLFQQALAEVEAEGYVIPE